MTPTHPSCPPAVPRGSVARRFTGFEALIVLAVCVMLFVLALPAVYAAWGRQHATGQPARHRPWWRSPRAILALMASPPPAPTAAWSGPDLCLDPRADIGCRARNGGMACAFLVRPCYPCRAWYACLPSL